MRDREWDRFNDQFRETEEERQERMSKFRRALLRAKEDPAGVCPARAPSIEKEWGHDYVKAEGEDDSVCAYCGRVEE